MMSNLYALLIGIDYYEPNPYYNSLQGAVRDIDKVASYLETSLQVPPERLTRLTAPLPDTNALKDVRSARQEQPPTYQNIVTAFNQITKTAQPQDLVYIHYSGHGGRVKTIFADLKGEGQFDEGLVPMDVGNESYYLRDVEMATLLKRMTDKGLIVTVVFDSCHSGGATRGDGEIRGARTGAVDLQNRPIDSVVATRDELVQNWLTLTQNDGKESWLPNQSDYVFLGACRPSEYAYEAAFGTGRERNGALTYWMLDTLANSKSALTYQSLYNRVKGMIQSKFPNQLPMLLGASDRLVFGDKQQYRPYTVVVTNVSEDQTEITLDAGMSAGLSSGTRFAIYPTDDVTDKTQQLAIVELTDEIQADRSIARILTPDEGGAIVKGKIAPGASAIMVAAPVNLIGKVRLFVDKKVGDREEDLPVNLVDRQTEALAKIRQALVSNGWVVEVKNGEESHYQVAVGKEGEYEICIGMPVKNVRPLLKIDDPAAPQQVVDRLVHLVKYQAVQELDNPASDLIDRLEFELCDANKQPFPNPQNVSLKPGEISYLKIKNTYSQILNVAVLDLEPTWAISQVPIQGELAAFVSLDPGQETFTKLRLQLPENYQQAKETLKIFATKGLANFQWLTLPTLDEQPQPRGSAPNEELRTRSVDLPINPLNHLLTAIGGDVNHPPTITRAMVYESDPAAEWVTKDIVITVKS
jgi:Caspase domain